MSRKTGKDDPMPVAGGTPARDRAVSDIKRRQIDRAMKMAFEETLNEPLPDDLARLVDALKKKERGE